MEHREAAETDLLCATCHCLDDIGVTLSWSAALSYYNSIQPDSACGRLLAPESAAWATLEKTNSILADIFDVLAQINANIVAIGNGKPAKQPEPYPRPGKAARKGKKQRSGNTSTRHFGSGALPPDQLRAWMAVKRTEAQLRQHPDV